MSTPSTFLSDPDWDLGSTEQGKSERNSQGYVVERLFCDAVIVLDEYRWFLTSLAGYSSEKKSYIDFLVVVQVNFKSQPFSLLCAVEMPDKPSMGD